jgi:hypothetical protein
MASRRLINPAALVGLAHVLQSAYPKMTAQVAVGNAKEIIRGLHMQGLEIGPADAFGPQAVANTPLDGLDLVADMIERELGRKPWLPDGS